MRGIKLLVFLVVLSLSACGQFNVTIEPVASPMPTVTAELPTNTAVITPTTVPTEQINPTATFSIPSATPVLPTATQVQQVPPATSTPVPTTAGEQMIQIVLIELEGNGQSGPLVGCGDSAIPINVTIPRTQAVLRAALEKLFSAKQQFYGESGYYNALYQSDLRVDRVAIEQGTAVIHLIGSIVLGGTCDAPRVQAQIEQTALQFSTVKDVEVFVNGTPLADVLSSQ
ncbi:MAG TPA: GerMN domain-containing protein [Anaerolineales bacterium]|nr:GerMN domain-containing protein [Anaerolineales bacterium]